MNKVVMVKNISASRRRSNVNISGAHEPLQSPRLGPVSRRVLPGSPSRQVSPCGLDVSRPLSPVDTNLGIISLDVLTQDLQPPYDNEADFSNSGKTNRPASEQLSSSSQSLPGSLSVGAVSSPSTGQPGHTSTLDPLAAASADDGSHAGQDPRRVTWSEHVTEVSLPPATESEADTSFYFSSQESSPDEPLVGSFFATVGGTPSVADAAPAASTPTASQRNPRSSPGSQLPKKTTRVELEEASLRILNEIMRRRTEALERATRSDDENMREYWTSEYTGLGLVQAAQLAFTNTLITKGERERTTRSYHPYQRRP